VLVDGPDLGWIRYGSGVLFGHLSHLCLPWINAALTLGERSQGGIRLLIQGGMPIGSERPVINCLRERQTRRRVKDPDLSAVCTVKNFSSFRRVSTEDSTT